MRFCSLRSWKIEEPSRKTLEAAATDIPLNTHQLSIANGQTELNTDRTLDCQRPAETQWLAIKRLGSIPPVG